MHYVTLLAVHVPALKTGDADSRMAVIPTKLTSQAGRNSCDFLEINPYERYQELRREFSRIVNDEVERQMDPYSQDPNNPDYMEFVDETEELRSIYRTDGSNCIRLPEGKIVCAYDLTIYPRFMIRSGQVYQAQAGQLKKPRRTKKAKKMTALLNYPHRKRCRTFHEYAMSCSFYSEEQDAYGYYENPRSTWDWYQIGGRWPDMFLVKDTCAEIYTDSYDYMKDGVVTPVGYLWTAAARKRDIQWSVMQKVEKDRAEQRYLKLRDAFYSGQFPPEYRCARLCEDGITECNGLLYRDGETLEEYLARNGFTTYEKYPNRALAYLPEEGWKSLDTLSLCGDVGTSKEYVWKAMVDTFIEGLAEDTVLVGVDCHQ